MIISLDTETTGLDLYHGARPFLVTTANEQGENLWWEWYVDPMTRKVKVREQDLDEIQEMINSADELILQNPKYDVGMLEKCFEDSGRTLVWDWSKVRCTLMAGHLLRSNQPHDLTSAVLVYLRTNIQPFDDAVKVATIECRKMAQGKDPRYRWRIAREGLSEMPSARSTNKGTVRRGAEDTGPWKSDMWLPRYVARLEGRPKDDPYWTVTVNYANSDSMSTLHLYRAMEEILKKKGLWRIYLARLTSLRSFYMMEKRGITVSKVKAGGVQKKLLTESVEAGESCKRIARSFGYDLNLPKSGNNKSLLGFVFGKDGLNLEPFKRSPKTKAPSFDGECIEHYLRSLGDRSKAKLFLTRLQGKRKRDTAVGYIEGYRKFWLPLYPGWYILHPRLNPTGTNTLRTSSSSPNEQNISKQEGFNVRKVFGPSPGREWWSLDYDNLELRLPAYESGEEVMIEIFEKPNDPPYFGSYHLLNASILYPDLFWPLAGKKGAFKQKYGATNYRWAKFFGFAVGYGAIPESGTADRAARVPGAQRKVMDHLKKHTSLNRYWIDFANRYGYVETMPDRTVDPNRGYPLYCPKKDGRISPTVPLNYHIQSTACWCTMKASVRCQEYLDNLNSRPGSKGYYQIMNVHDEIVFDFPVGTGEDPWRQNLPKVRRLKKIMEMSGDDVGVPLVVSVEYHGEDWGSGRKVI